MLVTLLYYLDFFKSAILLHIKTVKLNFFFNLKGQASCFSKRKKRSNRLSQEKRVSMMPLKAAIRSHVASAEKRSWARLSPQCFRWEEQYLIYEMPELFFSGNLSNTEILNSLKDLITTTYITIKLQHWLKQ